MPLMGFLGPYRFGRRPLFIIGLVPGQGTPKITKNRRTAKFTSPMKTVFYSPKGRFSNLYLFTWFRDPKPNFDVSRIPSQFFS